MLLCEMDSQGVAKTLPQIQQWVCHLIASFVHFICLTSYTYKVIDCKCRGMNCLAVEVSQTFLENNCLIIWHRKSVPTKTLQQIQLQVCHVMASFVHMYTILFVSLAFFQWIIIPLLSSAVAQFKKYKSPRMKRYLSKRHCLFFFCLDLQKNSR